MFAFVLGGNRGTGSVNESDATEQFRANYRVSSGTNNFLCRSPPCPAGKENLEGKRKERKEKKSTKPAVPSFSSQNVTATQYRNSPCRGHRFPLGSKAAAITSRGGSPAGALREPGPRPPRPGGRRQPGRDRPAGGALSTPPAAAAPAGSGGESGIWGRVRPVPSPPSTTHCGSAVLSTEVISCPVKLAGQT